MKNLLILFIGILLFACKPENSDTSITKISGKIDNPNRSGVVITKGKFSQEIKLDSIGQFDVALEDLEEGIYTFWDSVESTKFYIHPGKDLTITLDAKEFDESITYEGEGASTSNFMAAKFMDDEKNPVDYKDLYSKEEAEFKEGIEAIAERKSNFLNSFSDLPQEFVEIEKKNISYESYSFISNYKGGHGYYAKKENFKPSEEFLAPLKNLDYTNESDYLNIASYKNLVIGHFTSGDIADNIAKLSELKSELIKTDVLSSLRYGMRPGHEDLKEIYDGLFAASNDEDFKSDLTERYEKYIKLAKGNPSPTFLYVDTEGKKVSLEDLKGKVVYVDVWATWCGPCKAEIPHLKKLTAEFSGKEIAFVSISVDKEADKEKWLKMVAEEELKGYQLFADKDWKSDFVQKYGIDGIPRFILIDQKGNIVSPDAPRPSSGEEIKKLITELGV